MNNVELALHFFLQIAVILLACRAVGWVARRMGQPQVVAEMVTGVLLGPSCWGALSPDWQAAVFPWDPTQAARDTQSYLYPAAQLGLALYMLVVGLEFRLDIVRSHLKSSIAVSLAGMLAPFLLGAGLGALWQGRTDFFPPPTDCWEAMLFVGASMCITAFPMLARIIHAKGLTDTTIGAVSIGAGAINDAAAWGLLAVILSQLENDISHLAWTLGGGLGLVAGAAVVGAPVLRHWEHRFRDGERLSETGFAVLLAIMGLNAWFTDWIGLHAVFGAFVTGAMIPRGPMTRDMVQRVHSLTTALLLPLFFAYSGLNTRFDLLNSSALWWTAFIVLAAAVAGKAIACWAAARATGLCSTEAWGIGILMNARGLMELVMLNIGLQKGLISTQLFAILVFMAITTTLMTSPLFDLFVARRQRGTLSSPLPMR